MDLLIVHSMLLRSITLNEYPDVCKATSTVRCINLGTTCDMLGPGHWLTWDRVCVNQHARHARTRAGFTRACLFLSFASECDAFHARVKPMDWSARTTNNIPRSIAVTGDVDRFTIRATLAKSYSNPNPSRIQLQCVIEPRWFAS